MFHEEVDFIVSRNRKIEKCIQVCWNLDSPKILDREIRALLKAGQELECKELLILSEEKEETRDTAGFDLRGTIQLKPLWKWLGEPL